MPIIYLFGVDKTGKSTLSKMLAKNLHAKNLKVKLSWMRGSHTLTSLLSKLLSKTDVFKGEANPYYGINIPPNLSKVWWLLEYISALPIILVKYVLPHHLGYIVVADRYVLDLIVWITLITNEDIFLRSLLAKHLISLARKTKLRFHTITTIEEAYKRGGGEKSFLKRQLNLYKTLNSGSYTVDTTIKRPEESLKEILNIIESEGLT